jgi:ankyrin repeat protein
MPKPIWLLTLFFFTIPILLAADDLGEQLLAASRKGDVAVVKQLLDKGADVNAKNRYNSTPLFFACDRGHFEVAKLLIERGADMNVKDNFYNATALTWAMNKKHNDIVELMITKGVDATDAFRGSIQGNDQKMFQMVLEKGKVNQSLLDEGLLMAKIAKREEMIKTLEGKGAKNIEIPIDEATAKLYEGKYQDGDSVFTFVIKDGKLAFSQQNGSIALIPVAKDQFRLIQFGLHFFFDRDEKGAVNGVRYTARGGETKMKKVS